MTSRAARSHAEDDLQMAVAQLLDLVIKPPSRWWHTPNGGRRDAREAARLKRMGVKAGVPDVRIETLYENDDWSFGTPSIFEIELKTGKNKQTEAQKQWERNTIELGGKYAVCRSLAEVEAKIKEWGVMK